MAWRPNTAMPAGSGDRWPDDYERGRPGYPPAAVEVADLPASSTVLDLGAGTGKLTRVLAGRFARVVAVEPADEMRRVLATACPDAEALDGTAEAIPLADRSVDAVFAAEAFHWFDGERAVPEIARVLRPRGALVLMWNVPAGPTEPSIEAVERLVEELGRSREEFGADPLDLVARPYASDAWRGALAGSAFEELRESRVPNVQTLDRDGFVAFVASMGWLADRPDAERAALLERIKTLLTADQYRRPWETHVCWARLARPSSRPLSAPAARSGRSRRSRGRPWPGRLQPRRPPAGRA